MPWRVFFRSWAVITQMTHSSPSKTLQNVKEMKRLDAIWCPNIAINNILQGFDSLVDLKLHISAGETFITITWDPADPAVRRRWRLTDLCSPLALLLVFIPQFESLVVLLFVMLGRGGGRGVLVVGLTSGQSGRCTHEPSCCLAKSRKVHREFFCCFRLLQAVFDAFSGRHSIVSRFRLALFESDRAGNRSLEEIEGQYFQCNRVGLGYRMWHCCRFQVRLRGSKQASYQLWSGVEL